MHPRFSTSQLIAFLTLIIISSSCNAQEVDDKLNSEVEMSPTTVKEQLAEYVINTFEDSKGNLWFGTLNKGVAKYDGNSLQYLTKEDGLPGNMVLGIVEDQDGKLWMGTDFGLSLYDGQSFTNYNTDDGLCHNRISGLIRDSKGTLWIGTWGGVCQFDGQKFTKFDLPYPKLDTPINEDTVDWITSLMEDSQGNIWIGRDGYGAVKYDGKSLTTITTKDGLHSNNIQEITEDLEGNFWFGTRVAEKDNPDPDKRKGKGGVNKYDGKTCTSFPDVKGFTNNDVYEIYVDNSGVLWISTIHNGVYRQEGNQFVHFDVPISIMSIQEDKNGTYWLGGAGGLYKINQNGEVINVTTDGPWE